MVFLASLGLFYTVLGRKNTGLIHARGKSATPGSWSSAHKTTVTDVCGNGRLPGGNVHLGHFCLIKPVLMQLSLNSRAGVFLITGRCGQLPKSLGGQVGRWLGAHRVVWHVHGCLWKVPVVRLGLGVPCSVLPLQMPNQAVSTGSPKRSGRPSWRKRHPSQALPGGGR